MYVQDLENDSELFEKKLQPVEKNRDVCFVASMILLLVHSSF